MTGSDYKDHAICQFGITETFPLALQLGHKVKLEILKLIGQIAMKFGRHILPGESVARGTNDSVAKGNLCH